MEAFNLSKSLGEDSWMHRNTLSNLGLVYNAKGDFQKAQEVFEQLYKTHKSQETGNWSLKILENLAFACKGNQLFQRALELYRKLLELRGQDSSPADLMVARLGIGECLRMLGQLQEAQEVLELSLEEVERAYGKGNINTVKALRQAGLVHKSKSDFEKAESLLKR